MPRVDSQRAQASRVAITAFALMNFEELLDELEGQLDRVNTTTAEDLTDS